MATKKQLEEQLAKAQTELAQKNTNVELPKHTGYSFTDEMDKIRKKATVESESIKVQEFIDHKNIALYTRWGFRVGSMHRTNAEAALRRFADVGVQLTVNKPTQEEIDTWKESPEGKAWCDKEKRRRDIKIKASRKGNMEKMLAEMAALTGQTVESINKLLAQPVSLSEGRKMVGLK